MGDVAKVLGRGSVFRWKDKDWRISPWTYNVMADYEEYLEGEAWKAFKRASKHLSDQEKAELRSQTAREIAKGRWSFGSQDCAESFMCPKHFQFFAYLLLEQNAGVTKNMVEQMFEDEPVTLLDKVMEAGARSDPPEAATQTDGK